MNLATAFARAAHRDLNKTALYWGGERYSFGQLLDQSARVAAYLLTRGVKPGDRVGLWLKNCPEFIPALFGILHAGAVAVPINNFLKAAEVEYILADAEAKVLITDVSLGKDLPVLTAALPGLQGLEIESILAAAGGLEPAPLPDTPEGSLAVIIYTSGTTGRPKGAMLSHGNLLHNVESCRLVLECVDQDRMAVLLPMFHSFMLCVGVFLPLLMGGSIVLIRSLHHTLTEVCQNGATILPAIPQFFRSLINTPKEVVLPLRMCISGAAPLPVQTLTEFGRRFSFPLIEGYGLSEASPVVTKNPLNGPRKAGSIGRPIPNVEVSIQDDAGAFLPTGGIGELCVRGGNVMMGYWKQPAETAKAMRGDWLLTGDIGYCDADGFLFITDRKKDMLLVNGINVYPRELEEIIYHFPGVKEAAVIGVPDAKKGEQPLAFVVPNDGVVLDESAILQHLRARLADYKLPRRVVFMTALPRNATGKVLKTALRQLAGSSGDIAAQ